MLLMLCGAALASELPGAGEGDLALGAWMPMEQTFDSRTMPDFSLIGGARFGITDRLSVAFPAVFRFRSLQTGDGELTVYGGLTLLGYGSLYGLVQGYSAGVEGRWALEWADGVAWADVGFEALPRFQEAGFDTVTSWSAGVAPVIRVGERWRFVVPVAISGTLGDPNQAISLGVTDPKTWTWRSSQTFGGVPQPTVAFWMDRHWSFEGYLGATWRAGVITTHQFVGVGYHW